MFRLACMQGNEHFEEWLVRSLARYLHWCIEAIHLSKQKLTDYNNHDGRDLQRAQ